MKKFTIAFIDAGVEDEGALKSLREWQDIFSNNSEYAVFFFRAAAGERGEDLFEKIKPLQPNSIVYIVDEGSISAASKIAGNLNSRFHYCPSVVAGEAVLESPEEILSKYDFDIGVKGKSALPLQRLYDVMINNADKEISPDDARRIENIFLKPR